MGEALRRGALAKKNSRTFRLFDLGQIWKGARGLSVGFAARR